MTTFLLIAAREMLRELAVVGRFDAHFRRHFCRIISLPREVQKPTFAFVPCESSESHVVPNAHFKDEALLLSIFGD